ncbi:MAG: hypothetical protein H6711_00385 [Myxococcales bacterium]|nr:hypothetical protein [Myxococcales bacterium]
MRLRLLSIGPLALLVALSAACDDEHPSLDGDQIRTRCLDAAAEAPDSFILGGSWSGGCDDQGRCEESLRIESSCLTYQALDAEGRVIQLNHAILTDFGVSEAKARAAALADVALPPLADACGDGECPEGMIALIRGGDADNFEWRGQPPAELASVFDYIDWVRLSVRACAANDWLTIDEGCERL